MGNNENKNCGKNTKKGIGLAILAALVGGAGYAVYKAKNGNKNDDSSREDFDSDTVIDEIPGDNE